MEVGGRSTVVIWVIAAALAVVAAIRLFGGGGSDAPAVRIDGPAPVGHTGGPSSSRSVNAAQLYVHVAGAVRQPGLIRVPAGTRVATALQRAGGPTRRADLTLVNLAAEVQDGQQIVVPMATATGGASGGAGLPSSGAATGAPGAKIHLTTATPEQLDEVDGIGPTLAERIIEYRDTHGGFKSIEELAQVEGIGEKRLATLREALQL
jgi:competence protein ComEA